MLDLEIILSLLEKTKKFDISYLKMIYLISSEKLQLSVEM